MNGDIKKHIDAARQVLVGVVPNPTSQIDQITNALIYKFMDDMDQAAIKAGGEPSFFVGDLKLYAWTKLMDTRIGNQERMNIYGEALIKFSESKKLPPLFRDIFKSAFLPYRSPEVLGLFLKEISYFDYSHPEELGNAYEYLLSIMSSQGDAGQFRTPRHIIDFIVDVVNPTKEDKVLDPACGTGGFLISAYKQILEQHDGKNDPKEKEKPLTPDQRKNLMNNFEGYDVDPGMVRIAQVNMYLHQFKNPKIVQYDTLSMEERWGDKFDVILANPPFMSPRGGVQVHNKFSVQSSRSEVLFVDYIMNHLRPRGRAGIIVPEGIIFQSGNAHKQLRKNLIEDGLYAVVSLPSGVFQPYSGVKTSILFFDNEIAKRSKDILFVKIENDGYSLGAQRREISGSYLSEAVDILKNYSEYVLKGKIKNSFIKFISKPPVGDKKIMSVYGNFTVVAKETISADGQYNLSTDRYREELFPKNHEWPMVKLKEICTVDWGNTNLTKSSYRESGQYLAVSATGGDGRIDKYEHEIGVTVLSAIGANCGKLFYPNERFTAIKNTITFTPDRKIISPKYLFYILSENKFPVRGGGQPFMSKGDVQNYKIPLPSLETQDKIVAEIDSYQKIIDGARQIVENWKPRIDIHPEWEKKELREIAEVNSETINLDKKTEYHYIDISSVENGLGKIVLNNAILGEDLPSRARRKVKIGDVLLSTVRPNLKAFSYIDKLPVNPVVSTGFAVISPKENVMGQWIYFLAFSENLQSQMIAKMGKGAYPSINQNDVQNLKIPLPSLEVQKQIIEKIEKERGWIETEKVIIKVFEQKIKKVISKLWSE